MFPVGLAHASRLDKWRWRATALFAERWPPQLPGVGLLNMPGGRYARLIELPRDSWSASDWENYALFLEEKGRELMDDFIAAENELFGLRVKISRKKKQKPRSGERFVVGLLGSGWVRTAKRRGRKPGSENLRLAQEALRIKTASSKPITDAEAARRALIHAGLGGYRVSERRTILNRMSELRRSQNRA